MSAPTRFVRDWIVSRYADKILDIIKTFKKSIQRIEFSIEESKERLSIISNPEMEKDTGAKEAIINQYMGKGI